MMTEGAFQGRAVLILEPMPRRQVFAFLELPPELRTIIYSYALPANRFYFSGASSKTLAARSHPRLSINTNLLLTNKQICSEAASVLYGRSEFYLQSTSCIGVFLKTIGTGNAGAIRKLDLGPKYTKISAKSAAKLIANLAVQASLSNRFFFDFLPESPSAATFALDFKPVFTRLWLKHRDIDRVFDFVTFSSYDPESCASQHHGITCRCVGRRLAREAFEAEVRRQVLLYVS